MSGAEDQTGYFLFSLDTELAWGYFDFDCLRAKMFSSDGSRERRSIERLLDVLDEFGIVGTWAVTGHLFYERCEECETCPILEWKGKYRSFEEVYRNDKPLWYGADVIETLLTRGTCHEIAFHGYTHRAFDRRVMSGKEARTEIQEWLKLSKRKGIVPQTVIFPRHGIGHLSLFREAGFICYRGEEYTPRLYRLKYVGKLIKGIDYTFALSTPPVYELNGVEPCGMINLPSSQHFFAYHRRLEMVLDSLTLHNLRINRMVKGVKEAADEKKIVHIWAHPWAFQTEKDFEKLRYLFGYVSDEMGKGRIQSIGMADLARKAMEQHREG